MADGKPGYLTSPSFKDGLKNREKDRREHVRCVEQKENINARERSKASTAKVSTYFLARNTKRMVLL